VWAEQEECNDARDRVQICCQNPSACLAADQRKNETKIETCREAAQGNLSLNQIAKNRCTPSMVAQIQDDLNSAYEKKCLAAITECTKACKGLDTQFIEECQQSKAELEKLIKQQSSVPAKAEVESETKALERVEEATTARPSIPEMPPPPSNNSPMTPTPEPGDDPISSGAQH